jgi:hypothetical protein
VYFHECKGLHNFSYDAKCVDYVIRCGLSYSKLYPVKTHTLVPFCLQLRWLYTVSPALKFFFHCLLYTPAALRIDRSIPVLARIPVIVCFRFCCYIFNMENAVRTCRALPRHLELEQPTRRSPFGLIRQPKLKTYFTGATTSGRFTRFFANLRVGFKHLEVGLWI